MQKEVDDFEGGLEDSPKKYEGKEEEAEREEQGEEDAKEQDQVTFIHWLTHPVSLVHILRNE